MAKAGLGKGNAFTAPGPNYQHLEIVRRHVQAAVQLDDAARTLRDEQILSTVRDRCIEQTAARATREMLINDTRAGLRRARDGPDDPLAGRWTGASFCAGCKNPQHGTHHFLCQAVEESGRRWKVKWQGELYTKVAQALREYAADVRAAKQRNGGTAGAGTSDEACSTMTAAAAAADDQAPPPSPNGGAPRAFAFVEQLNGGSLESSGTPPGAPATVITTPAAATVADFSSPSKSALLAMAEQQPSRQHLHLPTLPPPLPAQQPLAAPQPSAAQPTPPMQQKPSLPSVSGRPPAVAVSASAPVDVAAALSTAAAALRAATIAAPLAPLSGEQPLLQLASSSGLRYALQLQALSDAGFGLDASASIYKDGASKKDGTTGREAHWMRREMTVLMRGVQLNESPLPNGCVSRKLDYSMYKVRHAMPHTSISAHTISTITICQSSTHPQPLPLTPRSRCSVGGQASTPSAGCARGLTRTRMLCTARRCTLSIGARRQTLRYWRRAGSAACRAAARPATATEAGGTPRWWRGHMRLRRRSLSSTRMAALVRWMWRARDASAAAPIRMSTQ